MSRLVAALAAFLALAGAASAQAPAPAPAASPEADPRVQAAIQKAVEKAKEDLRNEMRAELQGAQSAAEFMGTVAEQPKVQLLELDGYFRLRGQMLNKLNLRNQKDAAGFYFFPKPFRAGSTLTTTNMRLRLEPTINASETVRVRAQIDVLDNYVLGSNANPSNNGTGSPYPVPFYGSTRTYLPGDKTNDRDLIIPRRVWGEVQTPVGLLSFGRMPSAWGLGILANAGTGIDQDFGDTVDRIQFALPPVGTPIGDVVIVPIYDFDLTGPLYHDPHGGAGAGQPLNGDNGSAARTLSLKIARLDTEEEVRRKLDRGERSINYGLYYSHRSQRYVYPAWLDGECDNNADTSANKCGFAGDYTNDPNSSTVKFKKRGASAHYASLWGRWLQPKLRVEAEVVGLYGTIGDANAGSSADATLAKVGLHMRQWGAVLQAQYQVNPKFSFGVEVGAASGDSAPGFGNDPNRMKADDPNARPPYGSIEGPQWGRPGDRTINNFRFNPAYQVDLIFYRRILGQVTDSVYVKPSTHLDILPGLRWDLSALYAQAQCASSTPSSSAEGGSVADASSPLQDPGKRPLALELDNTLSLSPTKAFTAWMDLGLLKPLNGMGTGTSIAWMIDFGLAARF